MGFSAVVIGLLIFVAVAVAAGSLYQMLSARRDLRRYPPPGALVEVRGGRLHARCAGTGRPPVIFEAGIAASSVSWSRVQPAVAELTCACSYDRAGFAWSDRTRGQPTLEGLVDQLVHFARALSLEPPYVLVGHSFGTFVVRAYAAARPAELAGAVLVDPITTDEWMNMSAEQQRTLQGGVLLSYIGAMLAQVGVVRACLALLAGGATAMPRGVARAFGPTTLKVLERLVGEVQKLPGDALPAVRALWCRPQSFRSMAAYLRALPACAEQLAAAATLGDIPLVVLSAANTSPDRLLEHEALARQSARGVHRVASRGGHWIHLDEPSLIIEAILEVVNDVRNARS